MYYKPTLTPHEIHPGRPFRVGTIEVQPFDQDHGYSRTLGFRFGPIAYSTDLVEMTEEGFAAIAGVEVWVVGVFRDEPHPTHTHVEKALSWIERVRPRRAVLTHLSPWLDYGALAARLPAGVEPAFDGMVIEA
jgi:phosphoribosyl 1,2-cyclic phosphate phosphodiesterase